MKRLFDRSSDLLSDRDPAQRARRLSGRSVFYLAIGANVLQPATFAIPFRRTALYLGMNWRGGAYVSTPCAQAGREELRALAKKVASSSL